MSPPSPDYYEIDPKSSRKREREVSVEPIPAILSSKDKPSGDSARAPTKKNRTEPELAGTVEEIEPDNENVNNTQSSRSTSPPSPPYEMKIKVRQISRGVEDLTCRKDVSSDKEEEAREVTMEEGESQALESTKSAYDDEAMDSQEALDSSDKGNLKRKHGERGTSVAPPDGAQPSVASGPEPPKRARDDPDKDENPRQTKRPTPPPEDPTPFSSKAKTPSKTGFGGFMAYASTSSPFASVKGQNIFTPIPGQSPLSSSPNEPTQAATPAPKRSGFEAFASSGSPFANASRSKSPATNSGKFGRRNKSPTPRSGSTGLNAFSSYTGATPQAFSVGPAPRSPKRAKLDEANDADEETGAQASEGTPQRSESVIDGTPQSGSPSGSGSGGDEDLEASVNSGKSTTSFGARLRAQKNEQRADTTASDEEEKTHYEEQELMTGEEDEQTIHQVRCKLFALTGGNHWQEKGTGTLKINVQRNDGSGARLIMRKEAVHALLLNVPLFRGMKCVVAQDPRYLRFGVFHGGETQHYNLRFASAKMAQELLDEITINIPEP